MHQLAHILYRLFIFSQPILVTIAVIAFAIVMFGLIPNIWRVQRSMWISMPYRYYIALLIVIAFIFEESFINMKSNSHFVQILQTTIKSFQSIFFVIAIIAVLVIMFELFKQHSTMQALGEKVQALISRKFIIAKWVYIGILFIGLIGFIASAIVQFDARTELQSILSEKIESVKVDGVQLDNPDSLLFSLKNPCQILGGRSHEIDTHRVTIKTTNNLLQLDLKKDSKIQDEYRVYYSNYSTPLDEYVILVCTKELNNLPVS